MFAVQPAGIEVSGTVKMELTLPPLFGSYDYIPDDETPVVMVGFDQTSKMLVPVGAGRIRNQRVVTDTGINIKCLDFIGFAFVFEEQYPILEQYLNGEIDLNEMINRLEN